MNRRQFARSGLAALAGGRRGWAFPVAPSEPARAENKGRLRVVFGRAPQDSPVDFYQGELSDRMDDLRELGYKFHAVRLEHWRYPVSGYLTGGCLFSIQKFPEDFAPIVAVFVIQKPGRRVSVALGENIVDVSTLEDAFRLPSQFAGHPHAL